MRQISCIIVDDERPAREELAYLLARHAFIKLLSAQADASSALEAIERDQPDLVFLDIQMPGASGFDLLMQLGHRPAIVFCTAYDAYAIQAFEEQALDYLLKPVTPQRLQKTLDRLSPLIEMDKSAKRENEKICLSDGKRVFFVSPMQIFLIEAHGNYVKYFFGDEHILIRRTFKEAVADFAQYGFVQINRHQLVNPQHINERLNLNGRNLLITLPNGITLTASRSSTLQLKKQT